MKKKSFRYQTSPDQVEVFLVSKGYQVEQIVSEGKDALKGFRVIGTTVRLSPDLIVDGKKVAHGLITIRMSLKSEEETNRSLELYQALYKKFGKTEK